MCVVYLVSSCLFRRQTIQIFFTKTEKVGKDFTVSIIEQAGNYARSSLEKKNYIFFTQETHSYQ